MTDDDCPTETKECIAFAKWMDSTNLPFIHIPNGMYRDDVAGSLLKRMGVKAGFPDYLIFMPPPQSDRLGLVFDMKKRHGGRASDLQEQWLTRLASIGWLGAVLEGAQAAVWFIGKTYNIEISPMIPEPTITIYR